MFRGTLSLSIGELLSILGELHRDRETGTLVLQQDDVSKYLYFQEGQVIFAASTAGEDKFTQILVETGKLTAEQLELAQQKRDGRTIGKTLVELGFLGSSDLLEALIEQVHRVSISVLHWTGGSAAFKEGLLPPNVAKLPISTPRLVVDVACAFQDRQWVNQVLGGLETVIQMTEAEKEAAGGLPPTDSEQALLNGIDGKRSLRQVCESAGVEVFSGAKFFIGLYFLGLAHKRDVLVEKPAHEDNALMPQPAGAGQPAAPEPPAPPPPSKEPPPPLFMQEHEPPEPAEVQSGGLSFNSLPDGPIKKRTRGGANRIVFLFTVFVLVGAGAAGYWWFYMRPGPSPIPVKNPAQSPRKVLERIPQAGNGSAPKAPAGRVEVPAARETPTQGRDLTGKANAAPLAVSPKGNGRSQKAKSPSAKARAASSAGETGDAETLLKEGRFHEAARAFAREKDSLLSGYTVAVEVACEDSTIARGVSEAANNPKYFILPFDLHGRSCYRVLWGHYATRKEAESALAAMPEFFKQNASPKVASWASVRK